MLVLKVMMCPQSPNAEISEIRTPNANNHQLPPLSVASTPVPTDMTPGIQVI